jgi:hypothetical protein
VPGEGKNPGLVGIGSPRVLGEVVTASHYGAIPMTNRNESISSQNANARVRDLIGKGAIVLMSVAIPWVVVQLTFDVFMTAITTGQRLIS